MATDASRAAQAEHLVRLKEMERYPGCTFISPDNLANRIWASEGFIKEMAKRIAGDKGLDFDAMKQAVLNAIEIYEKEIAGQPVETNLDDVVGRALTRAKEQVDRGQSRLARATLRRAAEESRERFFAGQTLLYNREGDIALASYDGEAAAEAIVALAETIHGANAAAIAKSLNSEALTLEATAAIAEATRISWL
jgi:hypothetical protein